MTTEDELLKLLEDLKQNRKFTTLPKWLTMDYQTEYLTSADWKKIRRRIFKRDSQTCQRCGGRGSVVHHRAYTPEVMEGRADHLLITLCDGCHKIIEFNDQGVKRSENEKENVLCRQDFSDTHPEPKIDLRSNAQKSPDQWPRMTARQRLA